MAPSTTTRKSFKRINNTTLAYIAGILDGEGYIGVAKNSGYASLRVRVVNCRRDLLEWLMGMFGGYIVEKPKTGPTSNQCYEWNCDQKERFLKLMKPYIRLKRPQMEVGLAFLSLPHGAVEKKLRLVEKIKHLNKEQYSWREDIV